MARNWIKRILPLCFLGLISCGEGEELSTVAELDLERYAGRWYEVQRFPHRFERGLQCVSATYTLKDNGSIGVYNRGYVTDKSKWKDIEGSAKVPDASKPGQIKVTFFWPFAGDYYVIDIDEDYQTALVGSPSRKYLWILSRTPEVEPARLEELRNLAKDKGFDISQLEIVQHDCPE